MVKNLHAVQETQVQSLGQEDSLVKEMATYSSILAWEIPWMEEPGRLWSMKSQRVRHQSATKQQNNLPPAICATLNKSPSFSESQFLWMKSKDKKTSPRELP